jgi:hypothetical protein
MRCLQETVDDPGIGSGLAGQQVLRHALVAARLLREELRCTAVIVRALRAGKARIDTAANDWVDKRERTAGLEDPCVGQLFGSGESLGLVEFRKSRGLEQVALFEYRHCPSQSTRLFGQPTEPEPDRACDRSSTDSLDVARRLCGGSDPSFAQCVQELVQQERRSSRRSQAGSDKGRVRNVAEPRLHELCNRCPSQWR